MWSENSLTSVLGPLSAVTSMQLSSSDAHAGSIVCKATSLMPDDLPVLILPPMPIGKSNEHLAFPGTLSFTYETLARMWTEIGESVHRAGYLEPFRP